MIVWFVSGCQYLNPEKNVKLANRQPAFAGQFYPEKPDELKTMIKQLFSRALPKTDENVLAVISPHAAYVYSGKVAATALNQIDRTKKYEHVFVLGASHTANYEGASIYSKGHYITPSGTVSVDIPLSEKLVEQNPVFTFNKQAHLKEHSLEVQLPMLQYILQEEFKIIPILIGTQSLDVCQKIATALKPYFNSKNLFIISTDFSHYPKYSDAEYVDKVTAGAIQSNSIPYLLKTVENNMNRGVANLSTTMCGMSAVLTLLYMTEGDEAITINPIQYRNSGDVATIGDKSRAVGYYALSVTKDNNDTNDHASIEYLTDQDKHHLLTIAESTIGNYINYGEVGHLAADQYSHILKEHRGAFVTLHKNKSLRGCIGRFMPNQPLYQVVQQMAVAAATQDKRFPKVESAELDHLDIEVSVLTPMTKIQSIDEIIMGKHGIYITNGKTSGTFLPQVAIETGWGKDEFLGHCAQDKAGLAWYGWKFCDIYIFEAEVFDANN